MKQRFRRAPRWKLPRWLDDIKPRDGDENNVRSRTVLQQYNVDKRLDVHQGTPLKVLRMLLALATSKGSHRQKVCGIWDVSVAFFHSPIDEFTVVRPPVGLRCAWQAMGSEESIVRHSDGQQVFWEIGW